MGMDSRRFEKRFTDKKERANEAKAGLPTEDEPKLPPPVQPIQVTQEPGRNDPCPCGSGKKYKKCCAK